MKYLSIANTTDYLAVAIFDDITLEHCEWQHIEDFQEQKRMKRWFEYVSHLIHTYSIGVVVMHEISDKLSKKQIERVSKVQAIIQLACYENKVVFLTPKTDGWERYITSGKNTLKKKLEIVNKGYDMNLVYDKNNFKVGFQDIADAIILGEAIAHKRIHV